MDITDLKGQAFVDALRTLTRLELAILVGHYRICFEVCCDQFIETVTIAAGSMNGLRQVVMNQLPEELKKGVEERCKVTFQINKVQKEKV